MSSSDPITQVVQNQGPPSTNVNIAGPPLTLDLRGTEFELSREELTGLPESILLCLFPHGLLLEGYNSSEDVIAVDFDPVSLGYVLDFLRDAANSPSSPSSSIHPLQSKPAIIVLREDLDYYCISPKDSASNVTLVKHLCGDELVKRDEIFGSLKRCEGGAEQHLVDMLCASGFTISDSWGYRALEPHKTCISSVALARLNSDSSNPQHMATAQKLLLFWRKPARKCWWDGVELADIGANQEKVKVWIRRIWTLELTVIGAGKM
ncbi:WHI2-like protein [Neolecta irregularis DAH-3]|uniref:WHI2-like protein n=1 Tax=Neolecta irregularis (strain DAH-3) TaxID=1198029 RepID=A0A1U7LH65_NEOID|nr:WHI2-like protein [Neolecta irregularis DAH-3]|eukprot:OLL22000.1 WHI2-like protein [Neolecta irregularis DAH-3]